MKGFDKDARTLHPHANMLQPVVHFLAVLAKQQCSASDWDLERTRYRQLRDLDAATRNLHVRGPQPGGLVL